jgi:anti-anti-sigma regulatory factor
VSILLGHGGTKIMSQIADSEKTRTLKLVSELTIRNAIELKAILEQSLAGTDCLVLNAEPVTEMDFSCIQLLCSAHRSASKQNKVLKVDQKWSEPFREVIRKSGCSRSAACNLDSESRCLWMEDTHG